MSHRNLKCSVCGSGLEVSTHSDGCSVQIIIDGWKSTYGILLWILLSWYRWQAEGEGKPELWDRGDLIEKIEGNGGADIARYRFKIPTDREGSRSLIVGFVTHHWVGEFSYHPQRGVFDVDEKWVPIR